MLSTLILLPTSLLIFLIATIHYLASHSHSTQSDPTEKVWNVERTGLMISLYTSTLNSLPRSLLNKLNIQLARRLKVVYNAGIGFGLLGMTIALGGSCWATMSVWKSVMEEVNLHTLEKVQHVSAGNIVKRAYTENGGADVVMDGSWDFAGGLQPLIPGITMPWTHLPTLALALVVNQLIHELGHAISAALDDIQPSRFSFSLYAGIPSMMVSFPSNIDTLDPNAKMRLATSGPFHNLLTWFFFWLLTFGGVGKLFWYDRSNEGMVVKDVHWNSPLYPHLTPGLVLTHLDDIPLSVTLSSPGPWSEYLSSDKVGDEGRGWCMDKTTFLSQPEPSSPPSSEGEKGKMECRDNSTASERITFQSTYGPTKGSYRCLNPLPILNIKSTKCPCPDSRWVCIRPDPSEKVLRIGTKDGILLFTGPREEVFRDVRVRKEDARGWKGGVRWGELFLSYASTLSLSLFLFNLLPLPLTDGSQLLESLLEWRSTVGPTNPMTPLKATINNNNDPSHPDGNDGGGPSMKLYREYEMDSDDEEQYIGIESELEPIDKPRRGRWKEVGWKRWVRRGIQWFSFSMVGLWGIGWAIVFLLRSS